MHIDEDDDLMVDDELSVEDDDLMVDGVKPKTRKKRKKREGLTIEEIAFSAIREEMTDEEVIAKVKETYPDAKTSKTSVSYYRSKLRAASDEPILTSRQAARKAEQRDSDVNDDDL